MSREFKRFTVRIFIASIVLVVFGWVIFRFFVPEQYIPVLPWMLAFFALVTIVSHGFQLRMAKKDMAKFARYSMLVSLFRLVLYSLFAIIFLAGNTENTAVFVVGLVVTYLVFTFLEVIDLARITRKN